MSITIAQFGFGPLGLAIARRLVTRGYTINAWNRSPEKLMSLAEHGVIVRSSVVEAIKSADILISVLPDTAVLQEVLFDKDWAHELEGRCVIHLGSVNPSRSLAFLDAFNAHQADYAEVAVLGSVDDVEMGNLQLLVGATDPIFRQITRLLEDISDQVTRIGEVGSAVAIKLALQQLLASMFCAYSASVGLIKEAGLEVDLFMEFLRRSPLYAPLFDQKLPRLLGRDYDQSVLSGKQLERELTLFLEEAGEAGINAYNVESVSELIRLSNGRGLQEMDFTAVYDIIHPPKVDNPADSE